MLPLRAALRARTALIARHNLPISSITTTRTFSAQWIRQRDRKPMPEPIDRPPMRPDQLRVNPDREAARQEREEARRAAEEEALQRRAEEAAEFSSDASPIRNTAPNTPPNTQPGPEAAGESPRATESASEFSRAQDEFADPKSSAESTAPESQPNATERPSQPLPDLRQGIPSTFAEEYLKKRAKADPEPQTTKTHHDINITEDPVQASTEGGAAGGGGGREEGELPRSAYETSIDRRRNRVANWSYLIMTLAGAGGAVYFGRNWESEEEEKAHPDAPSGWGFQLFWNRIKARWNNQMGYYTEPTFPKLLPNMDPAPPYTLVLSLEDLMIHSDWTREHGWRTAKRPDLDFFLRYLSQYYELVLFTSTPVTYADPIVRKLDPYHIIMWPLFREATRYEKGEYIKDLSYLNRPLSKVIIMDTNPIHTKNQPENAIILPPWKGDPRDKELISYVPFLEYIASMGINDVREAIKSFDGKHIPTEYAKREAALREDFNKRLAEERAKKPRVAGLNVLTNALGMKPQGGMTMDGQHSVAEGLGEGKMLLDQIRERGMKQYEALEKEIRENGEKWLKEEAEFEKKAQQEQMKSAKGWATGFFSKPKEDESEKKRP